MLLALYRQPPFVQSYQAPRKLARLSFRTAVTPPFRMFVGDPFAQPATAGNSWVWPEDSGGDLDSVQPPVVMGPSIPLKTNGLLMPVDFPTAQYNDVYERTLSQVTASPAIHEQFAGAWNAVAYRFQAMADDEIAFTSLVVQTAPEPPIRYQQERSLFGFFSNGFSVFEATFYGVFALGALLSPADFPIATPRDQQRIAPHSTLAALAKAFPAEPLNTAISNLLADTQFLEWREIRNVLTHRAAPGRTFFVSIGDPSETPLPDEWKLKGIPLDDKMAPMRRAQLSGQLDELLDGIRDFTLRHF